MNKNLILWAIIIFMIVASYVAIFFVGRSTVKPPAATVEVKEVVKYDTATVIRKVFVNKTQYIAKDSTRIYADSIVGKQNEVDYKIKHTIKDSNKVVLPSIWEVAIKPHLTTITKVITRDSIQTKVNNVYLPKPFLMDTYFYTTVVSVGLLILTLLFH